MVILNLLKITKTHFSSRPFGNCAEVLTQETVEKYFLPIIVSKSFAILQRLLNVNTPSALKAGGNGTSRLTCGKCRSKRLFNVINF